MSEYENRHKGELVAILGCGPSIASVNFDLVKRLTTIGTNRICERFDPDYLVWLDVASRKAYDKHFRKSKAIKFYALEEDLPYVYHRYIKFLSPVTEPILSDKFQDGLCWSYTSIFPAISLAYIFGAAGIVIFGLDMKNNNHFYPDDDGTKHAKHPFPTMKHIHEDFARLKEFGDSTGFKIYNANEKSRIIDFPFIPFNRKFLRKQENNGIKFRPKEIKPILPDFGDR